MTPKLPPLPKDMEDHLSWYSEPKADRIRSMIQAYTIAAIEAQGVPNVKEIRRVLDCVKSSVDAGIPVTDGWRILESLLASAPPAPQAGECAHGKATEHRKYCKYCKQVKPQPLTREQVKGLCESAGYYLAAPTEQADFINGIRHGEAAHGIKE